MLRVADFRQLPLTHLDKNLDYATLPSRVPDLADPA
jgi:hypothetical protein